MQIEVLKSDNAANKDKGDLLEHLARHILQIRGYEVAEQLRVTGMEIDLLCREKVSEKEIYVECKAHKDPLAAPVISQLLGNVEIRGCSSGWLITTGPLSKDAKGIVSEWNKRPVEKRSKLAFFTADILLEALQDARLICAVPEAEAQKQCCRSNGYSIGEWSLLVSEWGYYWSAPILINGVPEKVACFNATDGTIVLDPQLTENLRSTDFGARELPFYVPDAVNLGNATDNHKTFEATSVVQVEHGDKWADYRPARPEDFVGRKKAQQDLMRLFTDIKGKRTDTRVFAIKGDSGIGKSSLVAKVRADANKSQKPNKLFFFAVDVRAANDSSYIHSALVSALREASAKGFGVNAEVRITNYMAPLESESVRTFMQECERKHELIILVFDQFEELYSKPELMSVFKSTKDLMFSVLASATNLALGFAWKTDTSIPQEHPAYHMWHELADHRYEIQLRPFSHADADNSLTIFEHELGQRIRPELRKYLIESSQGYPWLLKKLCIHFYEQTQAGVDQHQLADTTLDVASLFDRDMSDLSDAQIACLRLVARDAPMDWYEIEEQAGREVVQALQDKRLLIRRGDKLNLYWDIFGDYVLTGNIPNIPFTYIPQSSSLPAMIGIALQLDEIEGKSKEELAEVSGLKDSTIWNIIRDLKQFGVAIGETGLYRLDPHVSGNDIKSILARIRAKFKRHALTQRLSQDHVSKPADIERLIQYLKEINPTAQHHSRTWRHNARKMAQWLEMFGLARKDEQGYIYQDSGDITADILKQVRGSRHQRVFLGEASPAKVIEALQILKQGNRRQAYMKSHGYRNACSVLYRFGLIELTEEQDYKVVENTYLSIDPTEAVWKKAQQEETLGLVVVSLREQPNTSAQEVGKLVGEYFSRDWKPASLKRVGNSLKQWAGWTMAPMNKDGTIPAPPGRTEPSIGQEDFDHYLEQLEED